MLFLTEDAKVVCDHRMGIITNAASQDWVTIDNRRILVSTDPEGRPIKCCPNYGPTIKPCTTTLKVKEGYSEFIRIDGHEVCLATVRGLTDGTPPGTVNYLVLVPGQELCESV